MVRLGASWIWMVSVVMAVVPSVLGGIPSYFKIKTPGPSSPWQVGESNPITWISADEGVTQFDVELARLTTDGLLFVARNVSTSWHALNVMLDSVPTGDDYYVLFLDSIHGNMYSMSERFSILAAGSKPTAGAVGAPNPTASTVTLKGGPHPTARFAYTFAGTSGAGNRWGVNGFGWNGASGAPLMAMGMVVLGGMVGSMMALW